MTPAKGDSVLLEKILAELGHGKWNVISGASAILLSGPDETGTTRERARLVAMPKQSYRIELAEGGRWRDARMSGSLDSVARQLVASGKLGPATPSAESVASADRLERLRKANKPK